MKASVRAREERGRTETNVYSTCDEWKDEGRSFEDSGVHPGVAVRGPVTRVTRDQTIDYLGIQFKFYPSLPISIIPFFSVGLSLVSNH